MIGGCIHPCDLGNLPPAGEPDPRDVEALAMYLGTGCVPVDYLDGLGGVDLTPGGAMTEQRGNG